MNKKTYTVSFIAAAILSLYLVPAAYASEKATGEFRDRNAAITASEQTEQASDSKISAMDPGDEFDFRGRRKNGEHFSRRRGTDNVRRKTEERGIRGRAHMIGDKSEDAKNETNRMIEDGKNAFRERGRFERGVNRMSKDGKKEFHERGRFERGVNRMSKDGKKEFHGRGRFERGGRNCRLCANR